MPESKAVLRAIHLGSGALGLGLTCRALHRTGFEVTVLNRSSNSNQRNDRLKEKRRFLATYQSNPAEWIPLADFLYIPNDVAAARTLAANPETVIITTALKETGLRESAETLRSLFTARSKAQPGTPLYFIACENAISSHDAFRLILEPLPDADKADIKGSIIPLNCVVDRICNKPSVEDDDVAVFCEDFAEWYIETTSDELNSYVQQGMADEIQLVESIEPYVVRKKWIVNALHLSVALAAHSNNFALVHAFLRDSSSQKLLSGLSSELETIFNHWLRTIASSPFFSARQVHKYCEAVQKRIAGHPQTVVDSTTRFKEKMIVDFIKDFHRKVVDPFLAYTTGTGKPLYYLPLIMAKVDELIAKGRFLN